MKTLLILGDYKDSSVNPNIKRLQRYSREIGLPTRTMTYEQLLEGKKIGVDSEDMAVMFFFPFTFWYQNCEIPSDTGIYGTSKRVYEEFEGFWQDVREATETGFPDRNISYVINPDFAAIDRDKIATHDLLEEKGVRTTTKLPRDLTTVMDIAGERGVFVKARYGACGKGITYLSPQGWFTNYKIGEGNTLENHVADLETTGRSGDPLEAEWNFVEITGNRDILKRILDLEMIVEEEITPPQLKEGVKFDARAYSIFGKTPHIFVRENGVKSIITNFSQGGTINHRYKDVLPEDAVSLIERETSRAANALESQFLGVDVMFEKDLQSPRVLEVQTFTGYPKIRSFNLSRYLARQIKAA